jgi:hypothetical protein
LVATPPSVEDILSPQVVKGKGAEECSVAVIDAYLELFVMHSLSTSEIRLHIVINVVVLM